MKITQIVDDFSPDTPADVTAHFTFEGVEYEIDLCNDNYQDFLETFNVYAEAGRKIGGKLKPSKAKAVYVTESGAEIDASSAWLKAKERKAELIKIREWARNEGHYVPDKGQVPKAVEAAYWEEHDR